MGQRGWVFFVVQGLAAVTIQTVVLTYFIMLVLGDYKESEDVIDMTVRRTMFLSRWLSGAHG